MSSSRGRSQVMNSPKVGLEWLVGHKRRCPRARSRLDDPRLVGGAGADASAAHGPPDPAQPHPNSLDGTPVRPDLGATPPTHSCLRLAGHLTPAERGQNQPSRASPRAGASAHRLRAPPSHECGRCGAPGVPRHEGAPGNAARSAATNRDDACEFSTLLEVCTFLRAWRPVSRAGEAKLPRKRTTAAPRARCRPETGVTTSRYSKARLVLGPARGVGRKRHAHRFS